jgi:DNA-binding CsgD family transcriptional regulator
MATQQHPELEVALDLVGRAYEAAAEPDLWPGFLHALADATDCEGTVVWLHDTADSSARMRDTNTSFVSNVRVEPAFLESYAAHYTRVNVLLAALNKIPEGTVMNSSAVIEDAELRATEYYDGWLRPQGVGYLLGGPVLKRDSTVAMVSLSRPQRHGPFPEGQLQLMHLLMPHLRRACLLHQRLTRLRGECSAGLAVLDLLPTPVWLLGGDGRLLFANQAGRELDALHDGLWVHADGHPTATDSRDRQALDRCIASTIASGRGRSLASRGALSIHRHRRSGHLQVLLYPLCRDTILAGSAAAMFILEPDTSLVPDVDLLRTFYGLTPAEARLTCELARGETVESYSEHHQLSANTVRTHLKRALSKTGTHQQSQLVSVVAKLGSIRRA